MKHYTLCAKGVKKKPLFCNEPNWSPFKHSVIWPHCFMEPLITCVDNPG